jgi:hypothetical protein
MVIGRDGKREGGKSSGAVYGVTTEKRLLSNPEKF